jgi:hypothetical protein
MKRTREEYIELATRMIDAAMKFEGASIEILTGDSCGTDRILVLSSDSKIDQDIGAALECSPRLQRVKRGAGEIWGVGDCAGFELVLPRIGMCERIIETIEEPEYAPTGRMIQTTRTRYVCADSEA